MKKLQMHDMIFKEQCQQIIKKISNKVPKRGCRKSSLLVQILSLFYFLARQVPRCTLSCQKIKCLEIFCKSGFATPHKKILANFFKNLLIFSLLIFFISDKALAQVSSGSPANRVRSCTPKAGSTASGSDFSPESIAYASGGVIGAGADTHFELTNLVCAGIIAGGYVGVKAAITAMNNVCGSGSKWPRLLPSPLLDFADIAAATLKAASNPACAAAVTSAGVAVAGFAATIYIQYSAAQEAYDNSWLCGGAYTSKTSNTDSTWQTWNSQTVSLNLPIQEQVVVDAIGGSLGDITPASGSGWIQQCQSNPSTYSLQCSYLSNGINSSDITGITYREWYYQGVEREDNSSDACPDVTRTFGSWYNDSNKISYGGHVYPAQRYYLRGTNTGNYACDRYNSKFATTPEQVANYKYAQQCCLRKSVSTVCIEHHYCASGATTLSTCSAGHDKTDYKFCSAGTNCDIGSILSTPTTYVPGYVDGDNSRMICVSTYNFCPYNFNIGGGSTICNNFKDGITDAGGNLITPIPATAIATSNCGSQSEIRNPDCSFNNFVGTCHNYCQYLSHCVIVPGNNYIYNSSITSPYFSQACLDFIGDSDNGAGYNTGIIAGTQHHLTAPIAQCIKETLENVFYNRAGHTQCNNANETPDSNGNCLSGAGSPGDGYTKGITLSGLSFFATIQSYMQVAIQLVLIMVVVMHGIKVLMTGAPPKVPEIMMLVIKIAVIEYFVLGSAWQDVFFDGIYNISTDFATIVTNIATSTQSNLQDGCQFGTIALTNGAQQIFSTYPVGEQYLEIWDALDCKIALYLGFGPTASVAGIAKIILPAIISGFTGAAAIYFALLTLAFGLFILSAALRALHIFLMSAFNIILLVYVSPITITCILFKRTDSIFKSWLNELIGSSLQPVLLFAYIGFFLTIFDNLVIGSAEFAGSAPQKVIVCDQRCVDSNGSPAVDGNGNPISPDACNSNQSDVLLDPNSDSVACMMNLSDNQFGNLPVLAPLGVALPILTDFFSSSGIQKILTITKAALLIYILSQFMDEIPGIASGIVGGSAMKSNIQNPLDMAKKLKAAMEFVQKRGAGAARKHGGKAMSGVGGAIKGMVQRAGDKGGKGGGGSGGGSNDVS